MSSPRRLLVEADGGSRGNPGPAGYGAVVRDADTGQVLAERAEAIGRATNNVAEYRGLIAGLEAAVQLAAATEPTPTAVDVRMDSKLVVEQMSGRWRIKHPDMQPLAVRAQRLARELPAVTYTWIPRAQNSYADRLANQAMDLAAGVRPTPFPASVPAAVPAATWTPRTGASTTWLLRHGQTEHSIDRRFSGRNDLPLTAEGEKQALAAAARLAGLDLVAVVSSPLPRARQTADPVADGLGVAVVEDPDLIETDFGAWEGLTLAEVSARQPAELAAWLDSAEVAPPGGESFAQVGRRVRRARARLLAAHPARAVLVVSHVTPIKLTVQAALSAPMSVLYRLHLDPAGLSTVDWYADGHASVRLLNDTSHLS
ncbi:bifunctional RNase H/acid phosphatase [soil metagenome]